MSVERRKVLEMVGAGKITADEAERLLDRLDEPAAAADAAWSPAESGNGAPEDRPKNPRFLRVVIEAPERDRIDVRVPLGFIRTGLKLTTLMPGKVSHRLSERGIDLSHLGGLDDESLIDALAELQVDIASDDGETIRVFCE